VVLFTAPVDYCPAMISEVRFAVGLLPRRAVAIIKCTVRSAAVASGVAASHLRYVLVFRGLLLPRQAAAIILSTVRSAAVANVAWTPSGHDRNGNLPPVNRSPLKSVERGFQELSDCLQRSQELECAAKCGGAQGCDKCGSTHLIQELLPGSVASERVSRCHARKAAFEKYQADTSAET
jgi:hypothetical protein